MKKFCLRANYLPLFKRTSISISTDSKKNESYIACCPITLSFCLPCGALERREFVESHSRKLLFYWTRESRRWFYQRNEEVWPRHLRPFPQRSIMNLLRISCLRFAAEDVFHRTYWTICRSASRWGSQMRNRPKPIESKKSYCNLIGMEHELCVFNYPSP